MRLGRGVMQSKFLQSWKLPQTRLQFLLIIVLVLGVFFRFVNLDQKVFWRDETLSSARIAGYPYEEIVQGLYTGREMSVNEVLKYQRVNPDKSLGDTLKIFAAEAPNHPPLYYSLARFWEQWFGASVALKRTLPALISLLVFPALYWLCLELFESSLTGWVALAIVAVSPIHLLYAQEMREYSLWTVSVVLLSASLLWAMRVQTKASWRISAVSLAIALYSHLFSGLVVLGQAIYVLVIERMHWSKRLKNYFLAVSAGLLLFVPWLIVFIANEKLASQKWAWVIKDLPLFNFYQRWMTNLIHGFFDVSFIYDDPFDIQFSLQEPTTYLIVPTLLLVGYSIYFLVHKTPARVWLFILLLMASTALPMVLPDLISGGKRSTIPRYQLPCYIGIQLAVAYLLSTKLSAINTSIWQQKLWRLITVAIISCGVLSCVVIAQADTWWSKYTNYYNSQVARIINQSPSPLLLSDSDYDRILSLSHQLDSKVRLQLVASPRLDPKIRQRLTENPQAVVEIPQEKLPEISKKFSDVFLIELVPPPSFLHSSLKKHKNFNFELVYVQEIGFNKLKTLLWKLTKPIAFLTWIDHNSL
ncbi:MAG TPA: hypothetical protein DCE56_42375 [Cyanobacteria bacterium UBA8553]|nr:hypothetical protein [Cyanobacteria bacterium UBA8553]